MPRPVMLGVVGDSGAGKTTITRGLVRVLGEDRFTHFCTDDYHRYDRTERAERGLTPLDPAANYMDIMAQDLRHLRGGAAVLKPTYRHQDGTLGPPVYLRPANFAVVEGLLAFAMPEMRECFDVRLYLNTPEDLRRSWKVTRDCTRRGYTTDEVLAELDRRESDAEAFIRPQRRYADLLLSFHPSRSEDPEHLDATLVMRDSEGLPHPDLTQVVSADAADGLHLQEGSGESVLNVPGDLEPGRAVELEEMIWERMHFASHLRQARLGEFTVGTSLRRSESLALVQLIILYHLVVARAAVALGGAGTRKQVASST